MRLKIMDFWQKVGDVFQTVAETLTNMYIPDGVTTIIKHKNTINAMGNQGKNIIDIINADYQSESRRLSNQRKNILERIDADWNLEEERDKFQALMENRRQEFEVKKLAVQWLQQYHLEKDAQQFNYEEVKSKYQKYVDLARINEKNLQKVYQFVQEWENTRLQKPQDFELTLFEARKKQERELKEYDQETNLIIANTALRNTLVSAEYSRTLAQHPLESLCEPNLRFYKHLDLSNPIPLLIIISPPTLDFAQDTHAAQCFAKIKTKLTDSLREFLEENYSLSHSIRPTNFLGDSWENQKIHGEGAMSILHYTHQSIPTLVIESKIADDTINIYFGFWESMNPNYNYKKVISIPWQEFLYPLARKNAKKWREVTKKLLELGRTQAEIEERGGDNQKNLLLLEEEEINQQFGINTKINYYVNDDEYNQKLADFLIVCHCLFASLAADQYYLYHSNMMPILPQKLPELLKNIPEGESKQNLIKTIIKIYEENYRAIQLFNPSLVPEMVLDFAFSLLSLNELSLARDQLYSSLIYWLQLRNINVNNDSDKVKFNRDIIQQIYTVITPVDHTYINKVNELLSRLGESIINTIDLCYNRGSKKLKIGEFKLAIMDFTEVIDLIGIGQNSNQYTSILAYSYYYRAVCYTHFKDYQNALKNFDQAIAIKSDLAEFYYQRGNSYYALGERQKSLNDYDQALYLQPDWSEVKQKRAMFQGVLEEIKPQKKIVGHQITSREIELFTFDLVHVNSQGTIIKTVSTPGYQKKEDLGNGVFLEMVYIPPGEFMMGSNESDAEKPIHKVRIKEPFYMGKYPITNQQYKQIMGSSPSPSGFNAPRQPVVYVTWTEAKNFCYRLSEKTGKKYRLASETQWEYACKAGTNTPYYLGSTITPDLANYNGNYIYGSGRKGKYREKTTEVGTFSPNAFGLYDMHGNVWEWCEDDWHSNYQNAPSDGTAWIKEFNISNRKEFNINNRKVKVIYKVLRGGSWYNSPVFCRSAARYMLSQDLSNSYRGFRVVCYS
jgi:formylglycine-generating enzyme required for sulfatase activity